MAICDWVFRCLVDGYLARTHSSVHCCFSRTDTLACSITAALGRWCVFASARRWKRSHPRVPLFSLCCIYLFTLILFICTCEKRDSDDVFRIVLFNRSLLSFIRVISNETNKWPVTCLSHCWGLFLFYLHEKWIFTRAALLTEHIHTIRKIGLIFFVLVVFKLEFHFLANVPSALSFPLMLFLLLKTAAAFACRPPHFERGLLPFWLNWCRALRWELHSDCEGFFRRTSAVWQSYIRVDGFVVTKNNKPKRLWPKLNHNGGPSTKNHSLQYLVHTLVQIISHTFLIFCC